MKKVMVMLAAVCIAFAGLADSTGATTNWVAKFVAQYVANAISNSTGEVTANTRSVTTGEVTTVTSGTAEVPIVMTITTPSIAAMIASDCDQSVAVHGITNGTIWAWNGTTDRYERKNYQPIVPTTTNFIWNAIGSVSDGGRVAFKDGGVILFTVGGTFVTEEQASEIRGY